MSDTEIVNWLASRCFLPEDHPQDDLVVLIPERFSPIGSFTINQNNDEKAFRNAVIKAMSMYTDT